MDIKIIPLIDTIKLLDISDEEYFGEAYRDYISNSRLSLINEDQEGSPIIYKEGLGKHTKYSDSLVFGSAVHSLILQPNDFTLTDVNRPTAKLGFMADELYKCYFDGGVVVEDIIAASNKVDYYKGKLDDDKIRNVFEKCTTYWETRKEFELNRKTTLVPIYLDEKSRDKLQLCLASVASNKEIQTLLHPEGLVETPISLNEATLLMDVLVVIDKKEVILKLKAKLDNFTADTESNILTLNDLKTTGHKLIDFKDSFKKYHYNRQMAMYLWMLKLYAQKELGMEHPDMYANMLLVSTIPDFRAGIFKVYDSEIKKGFREFIRLIKTVAYCEINGYDGSVGALFK